MERGGGTAPNPSFFDLNPGSVVQKQLLGASETNFKPSSQAYRFRLRTNLFHPFCLAADFFNRLVGRETFAKDRDTFQVKVGEFRCMKKNLNDLRAAYDRNAEERENREVALWKVEERQKFLALLQREGKKKLLEIGAGPGKHGKFFQDSGLEVTCTDLSPEMVRLCREKGLTAYAMDFMNLDFPQQSFEAVYALNCLLHVPKDDLSSVLSNIQALLEPGGLFYVGIYGGVERAGVFPEDHHQPKRFFSYLTDAQLRSFTAQFFKEIYFKPILLEGDFKGEPGFHFQSMILRRPE